MVGRIGFALAAVFWVAMNVLLFRAEFGGGRETASAVPVEVVVERALNAADASVLTLYHRREQLGQFRWTPSVSETAEAGRDSDPDGMVRSVAGYRIDVEFSFNGDRPTSRWRLLSHLDLDARRNWRLFEARLAQRPMSWAVSARAGEDKVRLRVEEGRTASEQEFSIRDAPALALLVAPFAPWLSQAGTMTNAASAVKWSARDDWLTVSGSRLRVYRLRGLLMDRFEVVAYFSRAGELLRVTLPEGFALSNRTVAAMSRE